MRPAQFGHGIISDGKLEPVAVTCRIGLAFVTIV